mmetsp:Transcript_119871/g.188018  ORF Transcript_119871/g.188018 Transcript_119871/m.188018 type:complete len:277 (+) Transcript_119871:55-885(+)
MSVGLQLWWAILINVVVRTTTYSLRSAPLVGEVRIPSADDPLVRDARQTIHQKERSRSNELSLLATSSKVERAGTLATASAYETVGNPFSWLFGGAPAVSPLMGAPSYGYQVVPGVVQQPTIASAGMSPVALMPAPTTTFAPVTPSPPMPPMVAAAPPAVSPQEVAQMRAEIAGLRAEVANGQRDLFDAAKLITSTVEKDEKEMQALTQDVQTLRGRHAGSVPVVATECSVRQSSCSECLSVPSCVWCKVEQRCYSGDELGPLRGECAFFRHGVCS